MEEKTEKLLILVNAELRTKGAPTLETWTAGHQKLVEYHEKLLGDRKAAAAGNGQSAEQSPKPSRRVEAKPVEPKPKEAKKPEPKKKTQPASPPTEFKRNIRKAKAQVKTTPSPKKKVKTAKTADENIVTLKEICDRLELQPKASRVRLRAAYADPKRAKELPQRISPPSWTWNRTAANIKAVEGMIKGD